MAFDRLDISVIGMVILILGSLSIGLQTGVVMAGRSDGRGTNYHLVGSGIWGGCFSLVAGILTVMADSRFHPESHAKAILLGEREKKLKVTLGHKFHVLPPFRQIFLALFIVSILGFCSSLITFSVSCALVSVTQSFCDYTYNYQLWLYPQLFCYGGVASIVLIPVALVLIALHLVIIIFCFRTVQQPYWIYSQDYERSHQGSSATPSISSFAQVTALAIAATSRQNSRPATADSPLSDDDSPRQGMSTNGAPRRFEFGPALNRDTHATRSLHQGPPDRSAQQQAQIFQRSVSDQPSTSSPAGNPWMTEST